jgi:hypothetical protein
MPTIPNASREAMIKALTDLFDAGAGAGTIELQTVGSAEVSTHTLTDPAADSTTNGVATMDAIADDSDATGGTATKAVFKDSDGVTRLTLSVGLTGSGEDIEMTSNVIPAHAVVSFTASGTITMPAS